MLMHCWLTYRSNIFRVVSNRCRLQTYHGRKARLDNKSSGLISEARQRLLEPDPPVTAVFASSDVQAIGAWKAIREAGKTVPEDIALVGYDDIKTSHFIGLSSVDQNMEGVGREAAERLLFRLAHPGTDERIARLIVPDLRIRESSQYQHLS